MKIASVCDLWNEILRISRGARGEAEVLQVFQGLLRLVGWHQDMIMIEAGDDIGAYEVARQLGGHGRRQSHRV